LPVEPLDVLIDIAGFQNLTTDKETLINNQLDKIISAIRPFVAGADVLENKNDILDINKVISAIISVVPGAIFSTVTLTVNGTPTLTYTFEGGEIPYYDLNTSLSFS
jgi:hypothetical protein